MAAVWLSPESDPCVGRNARPKFGSRKVLLVIGKGADVTGEAKW